MSTAHAPAWHHDTVTADDARVLRAEELEESLRAAPWPASAHVMHTAPVWTRKPLTMRYRVVRAVARMAAHVAVAVVVVAALWAFIVVIAA